VFVKVRKYAARRDRAKAANRPAMTSAASIAVLLAAVSVSGCATTPAWKRADLASPAMRSPFARDRIGEQYRHKLVESRAGGSLSGEAPGGGCACTQ
jgi:hypothetical protein